MSTSLAATASTWYDLQGRVVCTCVYLYMHIHVECTFAHVCTHIYMCTKNTPSKVGCKGHIMYRVIHNSYYTVNFLPLPACTHIPSNTQFAAYMYTTCTWPPLHTQTPVAVWRLWLKGHLFPPLSWVGASCKWTIYTHIHTS